MKADIERQVADVKQALEELRASFSVIFPRRGMGGTGTGFEPERRGFMDKYIKVLDTVSRDFSALTGDFSLACRRRQVIGDGPDSIDFINDLIYFCQDKPFVKWLEECVVEGLAAAVSLDKKKIQEYAPQEMFFLSHAARICGQGGVVGGYLKLLRRLDEGNGKCVLLRIAPEAEQMLGQKSAIRLVRGRITAEVLQKIQALGVKIDPFADYRTFRYVDDTFYPVTLDSIREVKNFFGYQGVRNIFQSHFEAFARGKENLPLLVSSLPGLGKTHFSIAYTLAHPELKLILPEPDSLERGLEGLIKQLETRKNHKFVLFFDDIDVRKINWYFFRTNVGGSFMLPPNITIVIASNYEFPANISSRGRGVYFPVFDEIVCQEMVGDFLRHMGMKNPEEALIAVIAADYVEEFGQKKFEELSPRTLSHYLERYLRDAGKRKKMLDFAHGEVYTKPDAEIFMDFNVKIIRQLYGEAAVAELRNEQLRRLSGGSTDKLNS